MMLYILFGCAIINTYVSASLAPFITPCKATDTTCMKQSAQRATPIVAAGIPELGLNPLDPMTVERVSAQQAGLKMDFRNTVVKGLRNCIVMDLKRQGRKTHLELKCSVTLIGDYTLGGKLLIMPVEGSGKYKIKIRDILVKIDFMVSDKILEGQKYWTVTSWKHSVSVLTGAEFQFQNLFNGNKQLSDAVHEFANSSWKEIFEEVAPPIIKEIVTQIVNEVKKFFDKVPTSDLALD